MPGYLLRKGTLVAFLCLLTGLPAGARAAAGRTRGSCGQEQAALRKHKYELILETPGVWTGVNDLHQLRIQISAKGVRVLPLPGSPAVWEWALSLRSHGRPHDLSGAGIAWPVGSQNGVELLRGPLAEWFRNGPKGLQHGLRLTAAEKRRLAYFDFTLTSTLTPKVNEDGHSVYFTDSRGRRMLAYRDLRALDANGRDVTVRWERLEESVDPAGGLRLVVEGSEHVYPLRISSLLVNPKRYAALRAPARGFSSEPQAGSPASGAGALLQPGPPANDLCAGAEVIPADGAFPYLSAAHDITEATTAGDPPEPSCQSNLSRSIWFRFAPAASGSYTLSLCADAPAATTLDDTVLAVYEATGDCADFSEVVGGCDDDSCAAGDLQSVIPNLELSAGSTYYIVAWKYDLAAPLAGAADIQLSVVQDAPTPPAPDHDRCSGAEVIPSAGPFPYLTAVAADITGAKTTEDPPTPSCQANISRSIWYSFTPAASGRFTFSVCADAPTASTVDDTVLAIYTGTGSCTGFTQVPGACDDDSCLGEAAQSVIRGIFLTAGTPYYLVVWKYDRIRPDPGNTAIQLRVDEEVAPANDTCEGATGLLLDLPVPGTIVNASNDYELPSDSGCFTGIGQRRTTAPGGDVVHTFVAPREGYYSFRVAGYEAAKDAAIYVASDCPTRTPPSTVAACLGAANRNFGNPAEEVMCLRLEGGQQVFVYVDEGAPSTGSAFTLEANTCGAEMEPNDPPASAGDVVCGIEGAISPVGEADFFSLGIPGPGSRVFAMVDGVAANSTDYDLRVTSDSDTLEYDDLNNVPQFGSLAPNVGGTPLSGVPSYLRVSHFSPNSVAEPYRLYATVQPPAAGATPEIEPNNTIDSATQGPNLYYGGAVSGSSDADIFAFSAAAGDLVYISLDLDPARNETPFNGALALLDAAGSTLLAINDGSTVSSSIPGSGSLDATTPTSPAEAIAYRIRSAGTYYARVVSSSGSGGDYLLSIALNCRISPPTNLAVTQTDAPDPVTAGDRLTYTLTVHNLGSHPASVITLRDELAGGSVLLAVTPSQGSCSGTDPLTCHLGSIEAGAIATVEIDVSAPPAAGAISNRAEVRTVVIDTAPADDMSLETTTVEPPPDSDGDGVPDPSDCAPGDGTVWSVPGTAADLGFPGGADSTLLSWTEPAIPGGSVLQYDMLRSAALPDFSTPTCVATDLTATTTADPGLPGSTYYYLVRAKNRCGANLGTNSDGVPRVAGDCP